MDKTDVFDNAIKTYGINLQLQVAIEEMSELTKEICKFMRGRENHDQIAEEMADVEIMLAQMKIIFKNTDAVKAYQKQKIERLNARLTGTSGR